MCLSARATMPSFRFMLLPGLYAQLIHGSSCCHHHMSLDAVELELCSMALILHICPHLVHCLCYTSLISHFGYTRSSLTPASSSFHFPLLNSHVAYLRIINTCFTVRAALCTVCVQDNYGWCVCQSIFISLTLPTFNLV